MKQLATELNCFYSMELLLRSATIRDKVRALSKKWDPSWLEFSTHLSSPHTTAGPRRGARAARRHHGVWHGQGLLPGRAPAAD